MATPNPPPGMTMPGVSLPLPVTGGDGGGTVDDRITTAFRLLTSRTPRPTELEAVRTLFERERVTFAGNLASARALAGAGETPRAAALNPVDVAAWTVVASTIMNTDEAVNKR